MRRRLPRRLPLLRLLRLLRLLLARRLPAA
jgi:hypothetical protein